MSTTITRLMTLEEFEALPSALTERMEVVRGELVEKMSPGIDHLEIAGLIIYRLQNWALPSRIGVVGPEGSYVLRVEPLTIRTPDVSFWKEERRPDRKNIRRIGQFVPDLAIEIISPSERKRAVDAKVNEYLEAGVALVWTVWPDNREVIASTLDDEPRTFRLGDTLEFPEVLPGFTCRVDELFPE